MAIFWSDERQTYYCCYCSGSVMRKNILSKPTQAVPTPSPWKPCGHSVQMSPIRRFATVLLVHGPSTGNLQDLEFVAPSTDSVWTPFTTGQRWQASAEVDSVFGL